jgi:hypothetical protein
MTYCSEDEDGEEEDQDAIPIESRYSEQNQSQIAS